jgi:hypothetical protein
VARDTEIRARQEALRAEDCNAMSREGGGAPRYADDRRPDYDDEYGRTVYDYYGVGW